MLINVVLNVLLGNRVVYSDVVSQEKKTLIGASDAADVQLAGDRIKHEHAYLYCDSDQWHIVAIQGEIRAAGESIKESVLSLSKPVSIGPYILKLELQQEVELSEGIAAKSNEPKKNQSKNGADNINGGGFGSSKLNLLAAIGNGKPFTAMFNRRKKRLIAVACTLLVIVFTVSILFNTGSKPEDISLITEESYTVEQKREVDRYSSWVEQLWGQGDTEKAVLVSRTAYVNNPLIEKLQVIYIDAIVRRVESLSQGGQHNQAQTFLLGLEQSVLSDITVQRLVKAIEIDIQQKKEHQASYDQLKRKFDAIMGRSERAYNDGEVDQANLLLRSIDPLLIKFEPEWKRKKEALASKVGDAIERQDSLRDEQRRKRLERQQRVTREFDQCLRFYRKGDSARAYHQCQGAAKLAEGTNLEEEINVWLDLLLPSYSKEIASLTVKAEDCYKNKWVECAFVRWQRVLKLDPSNSAIQNIYEEALARQLVVARKMYQEARAYNDVGRPQTAISTLKELKLLYPLPSSDVYLRADRLIEVLSSNN